MSSFLKSIKGTLKNVQEDISGGLKSLAVSPEKTPPSERVFQFTTTVNYDAGADVLHRNENTWKSLYGYTEETGRRAQDVDIQIGNMFVKCDKQCEILTQLHQEVSHLPTLISQLQAITDSLAMVEEEYDKVEAALVHLENLCEEQEFHRNVMSHHKQLAVYKMKKEHELKQFKAQQAKAYAQKVEQVNRKRQHLLHEKQAAYDEQFAKEVDYYKKHGKPGRLSSTPESEKKLDLAEIELEEDQGALDDFLKSADTTSDVNDMSEEASEQEEPSVEVIPDIASPSETDLSSGIASQEADSSSVGITSPDSANQSTDLLVNDDSADFENETVAQIGSKQEPESSQSANIDTENHSKDTEDLVR